MNSKLTEQKLAEAKEKAKLFALDYDGTIFDGQEHGWEEARRLMQRIIKAEKYLAIITARAATAVKMILPSINKLYQNEKVKIPSFVAGANGTVLYEIKKDQLNTIYNHGLNFEELENLVKVWQKVYNELGIENTQLNSKGREIFRDLLKQDWTGFVDSKIIDLSHPYDNAIFTEEAKMSFILPQQVEHHKDVINAVQESVGDKYQVMASDSITAHITKKLSEDSKLVAVKSIMELLNIKENQVVSFGDMPHGNDTGLLSFPYSFTNYQGDKESGGPPFVLSIKDQSPVAVVHQAINYLLD
ncbi:MAG: HAD hydrolase family protein [bacterium]